MKGFGSFSISLIWPLQKILSWRDESAEQEDVPGDLSKRFVLRGGNGPKAS